MYRRIVLIMIIRQNSHWFMICIEISCGQSAWRHILIFKTKLTIYWNWFYTRCHFMCRIMACIGTFQAFISNMFYCQILIINLDPVSHRRAHLWLLWNTKLTETLFCLQMAMNALKLGVSWFVYLCNKHFSETYVLPLCYSEYKIIQIRDLAYLL